MFPRRHNCLDHREVSVATPRILHEQPHQETIPPIIPRPGIVTSVVFGKIFPCQGDTITRVSKTTDGVLRRFRTAPLSDRGLCQQGGQSFLLVELSRPVNGAVRSRSGRCWSIGRDCIRQRYAPCAAMLEAVSGPRATSWPNMPALVPKSPAALKHRRAPCHYRRRNSME